MHFNATYSELKTGFIQDASSRLPSSQTIVNRRLEHGSGVWPTWHTLFWKHPAWSRRWTTALRRTHKISLRGQSVRPGPLPNLVCSSGQRTNTTWQIWFRSLISTNTAGLSVCRWMKGLEPLITGPLKVPFRATEKHPSACRLGTRAVESKTTFCFS